MAIGNMVFQGGAENINPHTSTASRGVKSDGGSPAIYVPVMNFDPDVAEYAVSNVMHMMDSYVGGEDIDVVLHYTMASATTNNIVVSVQLRRMAAAANPYTHAFPSATTATDAVPGTAGLSKYVTVTLTGAALDGIQPKEAFQLRIGRVGNDGSDNATGDMELVSFHGEQA